ncbi:MAG TPA: T9SS type A sorting domain-containing protein [Chitinophagales bacterium]|nr:T9SS type A sorting domain-containing protein [Chitinophagales bacterium]
MKTTLITLLLFAGSCAFAQQHRFADSTAEWSVLSTYFSWTNGDPGDPINYRIFGDTVLQGAPYQVIEYGWQNYPGRFYIHKDSTEKVYGRIPTNSIDYLMYDFGKVAGDTFTIHSRNDWSIVYKIVVDSVSYKMYGRQRKVMHVTLQNDFGVRRNDIYIEGIGATNSFFLSPTPSVGDDFPPQRFRLLCFNEHDTLNYINPLYNNCDYNTLGAELIRVAGSVKISPNPATDVVQVQLQNTYAQPVFELTDITGRSVLQQQLNEPATNIPVSGISKGVYLYTIRGNNQKISSGKLVLQ